ncbi:MAG: RNA replicase beta chain [Sanya fiers-like virus 45]|nr:MAG: RNA replicase beta chain [Sanya fiers-like virus 45]
MQKQVPSCGALGNGDRSQSPASRRPQGRRTPVHVAKQFRLHPSDNRKVFETFFASLDTPISLSCYLMYKYEEYEQLVTKEIDPRTYTDVDLFRRDFAAISFLRKHGFLKTSIDKRGTAIAAFTKAELACKASNLRIRDYLTKGEIYPSGELYLNSMIRKIERILGHFDIDEVLEMCNWGPGVTQSVKGSDVSSTRKFEVERGITRDAYFLLGPILKRAYPLWNAWNQVEFSVGNQIITVPKNAKTDRTIAIEPGLNTWIQLGLGKSIRRRLRFAGFNLNSDAKNQLGAYKGSVDDSLATVDFSAASDTIARDVVELLLPPIWFTVLNAARSHYFTLDGVTCRAEKFSTMGNGFTFELESLIFVSAALAVCEVCGVDDSEVSVFGDDIIIPSSVISEYTQLVAWLGFKVNPEKSFSSGYFRESCGQYFFKGVDVKPIFQKKDLLYAKDLFRLANGVRNLGHRHNIRCGCDSRFRSLWSLIVGLVPSDIRLMGPVSGGDAVIHVNLSESSARKPRDGWDGFLYTGLPEVSICTESDGHGLLLSRLHRVVTELPYGNKVPFRARTHMRLNKRMFAHQWYDFGPWL